jgi:hypothetical protein
MIDIMAKAVRLCDRSIMDTVTATALLLGSASTVIVTIFVLHVQLIDLTFTLESAIRLKACPKERSRWKSLSSLRTFAKSICLPVHGTARPHEPTIPKADG